MVDFNIMDYFNVEPLGWTYRCLLIPLDLAINIFLLLSDLYLYPYGLFKMIEWFFDGVILLDMIGLICDLFDLFDEAVGYFVVKGLGGGRGLVLFVFVLGVGVFEGVVDKALVSFG